MESFYSGRGEERSGGDDKQKSDARSGAAWWGAQSKSDSGASSSRGDRGRRQVPGRGAEDEEIGRVRGVRTVQYSVTHVSLLEGVGNGVYSFLFLGGKYAGSALLMGLC